MKLAIGYTAYHEIEAEVPPEIEEAYRKYQKMWADYEADPLNAPYPCDYAEEDKVRRWAEKIAFKQAGYNGLYNVSNPETNEIIYCD